MDWLDAVSGTVAGIAITLLVVVNGAFALGVRSTRDRRFVNRWTKSVVVADAALLAAAVGIPIISVGIRLAAKGLAAVGALPGLLIHGK